MSATTAQSMNVDVEDVVVILSNHRRRDVVRGLDAEGEMTTRDLATHIARDEQGINDPDEAPDPEQRKTVYISLYQNNLPVLKRFEVVEFDDVSNDIIRKGPHFDQVAATLRFIERATEGKLSRDMLNQFLKDE